MSRDATRIRNLFWLGARVGTQCALIASLSVGCRMAGVQHRDGENAMANPLPYPRTPRDPKVDTYFGVRVEDPYRWLETSGDDSVKRWSVAQDALARGILSGLPGRQATYDRLMRLRAVEEIPAPVRRSSWLFYTRKAPGEDFPVLFRQSEAGGPRHPVLDPGTWSTDHSLSMGEWWISPDGRKVAYQVRRNDHDTATLRVADVESGNPDQADMPDGEDARVQWLPDGSGFYYTAIPSDPKVHATRTAAAEIRLHRLGERSADDTQIFAPKSEQIDMSSSLSEDGRWLLVTVWFGWAKSKVYLSDRSSPSPAFREVPFGGDAKTSALAYRNRLFVYTEKGAPNGRILELDPVTLDPGQSRELVPERPREPLLGFGLIGGKLALSYLVDATTEVEIRELDGRLAKRMPAPKLSTVWRPVARPSDDIGYYTVQSFTSPPQIYRYSASENTSTLWHSTEAAFDREAFVTERVFYSSSGGTRVPMFIIRRANVPLSPDTPFLLTGYGGFREVNRPLYRPDVVAWVESGGAYAIACLRGGGEYGETWHREGMLHNKQNVFDDFMAAADYLVEKKYTSRKHLVLGGASNGGLLVAAVIAQRPDIAATALIGEPLADMVRFQRLGASGMAEYGNPEVEADFRALFAYSPYHHLPSGRPYPATLVTAAEADERAHVMHARKLVAALQHATDGTPVLLRMDFRYAHMGGSAVSAWADKLADEFAFAAWRSK